MKRTIRTAAAILAFALTALSLAGCAKKDTVTTDGSTSMEKVIGTLAEAAQQKEGITVKYNPTGTGTGMQADSEGR